MAYLNIIWTFFKIGLFTFGGGYAMIPLIMSELTDQGLLTATEVTDIIAVSQVTPGTFAINAATFSGVKTIGILGGAAATLGVMLPSLILASIVAHFYTRFQHSAIMKNTMRTIRPIVLGLIGSAVITLVPATLMSDSPAFIRLPGIFAPVDLFAVLIAAASVVSILKFKISPIIVVLCSGALGVLLYAVV